MSYVLKVQNMKIKGDNRVVIEIHCTLAVTGNNGKTETSFFNVELNEPDPNNFIEFNNLTEEQVNSWVEDALGQDELNARVYGLQSKLEEGWEVEQTVNAPWA